MKIGVMGAKGSFSEQAGETYAVENAVGEYTIAPLVTAEVLLAALTAKTIDKAVFPIMNNTGGVVVEAVHALAHHTCRVETIFDMDIHHMLLVQPGTKKDAVTTITSHVQALRQCKAYLEANWLQAEVISYKDTAQAAADLAAGILSPTTAVLAPRRAAELYGLEVLAASVQDNPHNKTTFVVVKR